MTKPTCEICLQKPAIWDCGLCNKHICKADAINLDSEAFSFMAKVPAELSKGTYCLHCFDATVLPKQKEYQDKLERAEDIYFLTKAYPGYVRVLKRHTKRVQVEACNDRRETILRMAFFAVELGFNAIIEADVKSQKTRNHGHQSSLWSGSAMPAQIDGEQLERSSLRRI